MRRIERGQRVLWRRADRESFRLVPGVVLQLNPMQRGVATIRYSEYGPEFAKIRDVSITDLQPPFRRNFGAEEYYFDEAGRYVVFPSFLEVVK